MKRYPILCRNCLRPASIYIPKKDCCYCMDCAVEIVNDLWDALSDDEKLDIFGAEVISE